MSGGARYEIAIGGTPRTYRGTIEGAWAAATNLKMKQKRRHLPGKTVARDRPSSGGETLARRRICLTAIRSPAPLAGYRTRAKKARP
jgi:hypothetical protein